MLNSRNSAVFVVLVCGVALSAQSDPHQARAREIFKQLVEINTTDSVGNTTAAAEAMAARFKAAGFPGADVQVLGPNPRKANLVVRYRSSGGKRPILFLAHLDVVEAKRGDWSFDPFTLTEKDGYLYGRGTADDKTMAAVFVANLLRLKAEGYVPSRDLILALTADEEGGSFNGVKWLLENHRPLIDAEYAINEGGGGVMRKGKYLTLEVQAAEKVFQNVRLEVHNSGGHSSMPVKDNAIYHLAAGLSKIGAYDFPVQLSEITRTYFERSAPAQLDAQTRQDMLAVAKQPTDLTAAARLSAQSPYFNSIMRTTCVATTLEGGHALNALPQLAAANVNCRILPGVSPVEVLATLKKIVADPKIDLSLVDEATPSKAAVLRDDVMSAVGSIAASMFPGVPIVPTMSTGATDSLYLRNAGMPTFGVDGLFDDIDDVRAHGRDERVGIKQFNEDLEFQYRLIKALAQ